MIANINTFLETTKKNVKKSKNWVKKGKNEKRVEQFARLNSPA